MNTLTIVKIGGNVIDRPAALQTFLQDFAALESPKILVHGGGILATELLEKTGVPVRLHEGRRITDAGTLKICTMVYAGWINKTIVAQLQQAGCNAVGLSGADANTVSATKRPPVPVDFGFVGDVVAGCINVPVLSLLLDNGLCPVFCAITHDMQGGLLNTNADTMASVIAAALAKTYRTKLLFCFEKGGVLANPDDDHSVIPAIDTAYFQQLKEQKIISKGMLPKLDNAFAALHAGVAEVYIKHAARLLSAKEGTALVAGVKS
ncbi:MAG: acetylglutamate kinase [Prevotellaceae bacterium]|jgi:acetylglutamate kinase|nr:acetylglutamate kinase [Prevotellaceae bacterium]